MILQAACQNPVYQLDLWMGGEKDCRRRLWEAAGEADLILIEGAMGLFDGSPSSADLAQTFGVPVLAVINCSGMAQTFHAVAHGLATYRPGLKMAGVLANGIASHRHGEMVKDGALPGLKYLGAFPAQQSVELPSRHLGLVQAEEVADLDLRLELAAQFMGSGDLSALPEPVEFFAEDAESLPDLLKGVRIGIARDAAFSFLYKANLDLLSDMGASLTFFSPLVDEALPEVDSVYLPGGYPELYLSSLEGNAAMKAGLFSHVEAGKPVYAECGGMLYLLEQLSDPAGQQGRMCGILQGHAVLGKKLSGLGYQSVQHPEGILRGHTFHYSHMDSPFAPAMMSIARNSGGSPEPVYQRGRLFASYVHLYFPSNPPAAASLFLPG